MVKKTETKAKAPAAPSGDARHGIGGNMPPAHEAFAMELEDLRLEAGNFLDGDPILTEGQADAVGIIVTRARKLKGDADKARKAEKEPHLEAGKAVDAAFKPVLQTADDIVRAAQAPLTAWLEAKEAEQRRIANEARVAAMKAQEEAAEKQRAAMQQGNLDEVEDARRAQDEADKLHKDAKSAEKAKPSVAGEGRSMGLRSKQVVKVIDRKALLMHVAKHDPAALEEWLTDYARRKLPSKLPGCEIEIVRVAQ